MRYWWFWVLFFLVLSAPVVAKERVLAEIGRAKMVITEADLARYLSYYGPEAERALSSPERRRQFLEDVVKMFAVAAYAEEQGFAKEPEIQDKLDFLRAKFLAKEYLARRLKEELAKVKFTEEELRAYYLTHPEEFTRPARVRFSALVLEDPGRKVEELRSLAEGLRPELEDGRLGLALDKGLKVLFFADSGWRPLDRLEAPLRQRLRSLPAGQWSEPVIVETRVYLLRFLEMEPAKLRSFEEVRPEIEARLRAEMRRNKLRALLKEILTYEEVKFSAPGRQAR